MSASPIKKTGQVPLRTSKTFLLYANGTYCKMAITNKCCQKIHQSVNVHAKKGNVPMRLKINPSQQKQTRELWQKGALRHLSYNFVHTEMRLLHKTTFIDMRRSVWPYLTAVFTSRETRGGEYTFGQQQQNVSISHIIARVRKVF